VKHADVEKLEKVMGQLEGLHREISTLAKKSPNDGLNEFKLKFVNLALTSANKFLGDDYKPMDGFEKFEADELPTNSDVTFILSSYLEEIERMRADNIKLSYGGKWIYVLSDSEEDIRTAPPKKIKEKK
jgi:hypothetical protein